MIENFRIVDADNKFVKSFAKKYSAEKYLERLKQKRPDVEDGYFKIIKSNKY